MIDNKQSNYSSFPFVWPWRGVNNERISVRKMLATRKFSYIYLLIIWGIVITLDFASTNDCSGTWQLAFQCEYAFWIRNFTEAPLIFLRSLFTTMLLHNSPDHILFVTIFGVFMIIQSYEIRFGSKETIFMFLLAYHIVGPIFAVFYQSGRSIWPESEFFQFAFERNWIGGSLGFYFIFGAFASGSKRPLIFLSIPFVFEFFNLFVFGIDPHISLMHTTGSVCGFVTKKVVSHFEAIKKEEVQKAVNLWKGTSKQSLP